MEPFWFYFQAYHGQQGAPWRRDQNSRKINSKIYEIGAIKGGKKIIRKRPLQDFYWQIYTGKKPQNLAKSESIRKIWKRSDYLTRWCKNWTKWRLSLTRRLSGFEILNNASLIFQKWLVSRHFANNFHYLNFSEVHFWQFS